MYSVFADKGYMAIISAIKILMPPAIQYVEQAILHFEVNF